MALSKNSSGSHKKDELRQLIERQLPYWPWFLLSLAVCGMIGVLYLHFKAPVYQTTASILIKENDKGSSSDAFFSPMDVFSSQKVVENETNVLESYNLLKNVVTELTLYAPVSLERNIKEGILWNTSGYIFSPVKIEARDPDKIRPPKDTSKIYFTYKGDLVRVGGKDYPLNSWENSPWGEIRFVPNKNYDHSTEYKKTKMFFSLLNMNECTHDLMDGLGIEPTSQLSSIINLTYEDPIPERGKDILNAVIFYYDQENMAYKNNLASNTIGFLDDRIRLVKTQLDSIENSLESYKSNRGGIDLDNQSQLILGSLSENDKKINEIQVQLATLEQIKDYVNGRGGTPGVVALSANDNVLSDYLVKLYDAELNYDKLKNTTAENNVSLRSLKEQIEKIRPTILQYVDNRIETLEITLSHLQSSTLSYNAQLGSIPQKERTLFEMNRKRENTNDLYNILLKKKEEATLSSGAKVSDTKVIDHAVVSPYPVSPKKIIVMGFVLLFGLGIPFVLLRLSEKILNKDDLKEILELPFLGEISQLGKNDPLLISDAKYDLISEQFRQIRISLAFSQGIGAGHNKIMITSSISGEGKSFIAANLAINLALTDKKVLLVDLDLYRPQLEKLFEVHNEEGISDYLLEEAPIEDIITKPDPRLKNLFFIPSGKRLAEPSEMLLDGKISEFLSYAQSAFDYIVLDTAPINIISSVYNVSHLCDATLFVTRYKYTPKSEVLTFKENLSSGKLNNVGVILNGVKSSGAKKFGKKYYGYVKEPVRKEVHSV